MPDRSDPTPITRRFFWLVVAIALLIAALKRLEVIAPPGFPLGEGGLFVLFSEAIVNSGFALPAGVVYGGVAIPFAYPPAGFYLAAAVARGFGADLLSVYYWLPLLLNILAVPTFCFLAAQISRDRVILLCAAILYVQLPDSFVWQITGGGLPRSLGALFALLSVGFAFRIRETAASSGLLLCGLCVGLAILSHLEWGMFAATGVTLAFFSRSLDWKKLRALVTVGAIALIVILPWIAAILARHGFDPFLSSSSASQWSLGKFMATSVVGGLFGLLVWPAMLGVFITLSRGDWFLSGWAVMTALLTPRMGASAGLAIPASLLAAYGVKAAADFVSCYLDSVKRTFAKPLSRIAGGSRFGITFPVLSLLLIVSVVLASPLRWMYHSRQVMEQLSPPTTEAMHWIRERPHPNSRFVVLSEAGAWWSDRIAEWFPYLTGRSSFTTAQGLEWAGPGVFVDKLRELDLLKKVQGGAPDLMPPFVQGRYCAADYVAVFSEPEAPERQSFLASGFFQPVFVNAGAAVFQVQRAEPEHC